MTREEAIRILDEVIPPPEHHAVDLDHLRIAQAWLCIKETLTAEPVKHGRWIPCSERLPEEDVDVLVSYRYKEGEGDTSRVNIDITSYGSLYFGGRAIQFLKEWREPFAYFHSNYEVIAWMPLPEPYKMDESTMGQVNRRDAVNEEVKP